MGRRLGERSFLTVSASTMTIGLVLLAVGSTSGALGLVIVALVVSGLAWGNAQPGMVTVMANAVTQEDFGIATSLQQTAGQIGGVLGLGVLTALVADSTTSRPFTIGFLITAGLAAFGALIATRIHTSHPLPDTDAPKTEAPGVNTSGSLPSPPGSDRRLAAGESL
jgi:MFS family permease